MKNALIVSYDTREDCLSNDISVLLVGQQTKNKLVILKEFFGKEADDIYNLLTKKDNKDEQ